MKNSNSIKEKDTLIIKKDLFENNEEKNHKKTTKDKIIEIFTFILLFILLIISYKIYSVKFNLPNSIASVANITKEEFTKDKYTNITEEIKSKNPNDEKSNTKEESKSKQEVSKNKQEDSKNKNAPTNKQEDSKNKNVPSNKQKIKKRVGLVGVENDQNPGNNLIKYAMTTKLREYGFDPIVIARVKKDNRIDFLLRACKVKIIKNSFSELKKEDYDILMVNSDLSWTFSQKKYFYDNAFLKFAEKWNIPKFIYAASMGTMRWFYSKRDDLVAKRLLKSFKGISLREIGTARMAEQHLGIKPTFVLDPTFLLDKQYYLDLISNYKRDFDFNKKYLMVYQLDKNEVIKKVINDAVTKLNFTVYEISLNDEFYVENFVFAINISQAVICDSYHGSVFSIMFNKPFISFINYGRGGQRFASLNETFLLSNRIIDSRNSTVNISLLLEPLVINQTRLNELKNISINFLEKNLGI